MWGARGVGGEDNRLGRGESEVMGSAGPGDVWA